MPEDSNKTARDSNSRLRPTPENSSSKPWTTPENSNKRRGPDSRSRLMISRSNWHQKPALTEKMVSKPSRMK